MRAVVFMTIAAAIATAYATSRLMAPLYDARCVFYVVDDVESASVIVAGAAGSLGAHLPGVFLPSTVEAVAASHVGILQTDAVRKAVFERVPRKPQPRLESDVDVIAFKKYLLSVRAWDADAQLAADVANAYPAALNEFLQSVAQQRARDSLRAMEQSRAEVVPQLEQARMRLQNFFSSRHTPSVRSELNHLLGRKSSLESAIQNAEANLQGIDKRIELAEAQVAREAQSSMSRLGALSSSTIQRLMKEVSDLEAELAGVRTEFDGKQADKHPRIRSLTASLAQRQRDLDLETAALQKSVVKIPGTLYEQLRRDVLGYYKDRTATKAEMAENRVALERLVTRIVREQPGASAEAELTAEVVRLERMVDSLTLAVRSSQIRSAMKSDVVVVLSEAKASDEPKIPLPLFNSFLASVLGLIAGVYLAFACDWLLRRRSVL